jgi:hypothetical protein
VYASGVDFVELSDGAAQAIAAFLDEVKLGRRV